MYYRENDPRPVTRLGVRINRICATASIGRKLHDIRVFQKEQSFNQTELALLENVTHQRISAWLKEICAKAVKNLQPHRECMEGLLHRLK